MLTYAVSGSSSALVSERMVLLIDMPMGEAVMLWETFSAPNARIETVLSALMRQGVANLRDFVVAELVDPALGVLTVAVRGRGTAQFGSKVIEGEGVSTWIEHTEDLVMGVKLTLDEAPADTLMMPLDNGVVQTSQLVWGNDTPSHLSETVTSESLTPPPAILRNIVSADDDEQAAEAHHQVTRPSVDPVDEHTVVRRAIPKWMLRFTSGKVIGIGERVVVGRRPTPTIAAGEQLETLLSPQREVSSNHALLIGQADGVQVIDLRSTNGTVITTSDDETFIVKDGNSTVLQAGDRVDFGDDNEAECVRASSPGV